MLLIALVACTAESTWSYPPVAVGVKRATSNLQTTIEGAPGRFRLRGTIVDTTKPVTTLRLRIRADGGDPPALSRELTGPPKQSFRLDTLELRASGEVAFWNVELDLVEPDGTTTTEAWSWGGSWGGGAIPVVTR